MPIRPRLGLVVSMVALAVAAIGCSASNSFVQPSELVSQVPTPPPVATTRPTSTPDAAPPPLIGCLGPAPDLAAILAVDVGQRAACFGRSALTFQAAAVATTSDCVPVQVEPAWLWCPPTAFLASPGTAASRSRSDLAVWAARSGRTDEMLMAFAANVPTLYVYAAPDTGVGRAAFVPGAIVRVTGHFDDPAAAACRLVAAQPGWQLPTPEGVVRTCREAFVVTALQPASA